MRSPTTTNLLLVARVCAPVVSAALVVVSALGLRALTGLPLALSLLAALVCAVVFAAAVVGGLALYCVTLLRRAATGASAGARR